MLRSLLVDFNSYFASVEQQVEPRLRGKPLGVVPMLADTTVCIAASVEAKTFGVKTGTKVGDAKKLCPGIELVIARHEIYIEYHHRAVAVVDSVVPVRAVLSIDEMDCELTGRWREPDRAMATARKVKAALASQVGECLRTSIGIGPNTFIAKTASDMMKPDGLVMIQKSELPDRLFDLDVLRQVVVQEDEVVTADVLDVLERPRVEIVDGDDAMSLREQVIAEMGAEKTGSAGDDGGGHEGS